MVWGHGANRKWLAVLALLSSHTVNKLESYPGLEPKAVGDHTVDGEFLNKRCSPGENPAHITNFMQEWQSLAECAGL